MRKSSTVKRSVRQMSEANVRPPSSEASVNERSELSVPPVESEWNERPLQR
ncbi:MAG: hypothetical protein HC803_04325, partial [Saprospiraceae bacterium]|nr:hypothetical protein [Saprospiraceae bacterium]